jgi:cytoplasmic iron level regulating protein YaaA (DUF328/UPF0246 family)
MLILLPPSEKKRPGGVGVSIDKAAIIWAALDPARDRLIAELSNLCKDEAKAVKALKLGEKSKIEIQKNLNLMTSGTMPALERYSGVLFEALSYSTLSASALRRAGEQLFIHSALFGLLPAMEMIPDYRFSASSKLVGINLRELWIEAHKNVWPRLIGPILDLRSKDCQEINPVPEDKDAYVVQVIAKDGKALNHFNKKTKGLFTKSALENGLNDATQISKVAQAAGLRAEITGRAVTLIAQS